MDGFVELPRGGRLAYQVHGEQHAGIPLLLIRPLGGSMALWGTFRSTLAEHVRVISFDLRGTGRSSGDPAWVSTHGLAHDAEALLVELAVPRAHIFGISLGGMAASWFAIDKPARVARLCIACAPARGIELTHASLKRELALAACFLRPSVQVEPALVKRVLSHQFRAQHPDEVLRIQRAVESSSRIGLLRHALAGLLHDPRKRLASIRAPTLVLAGEHDRLLGVEPPRELASKIPNAQFEIIADSGHDLTLEQPVITAQRVVAWLTQNE